MKLSARNIIKGTIKEIDLGTVNAEVDVEIASGVIMTAIITRKSCESLGLEVGKEVDLIIKASNVMIGTEERFV